MNKMKLTPQGRIAVGLTAGLAVGAVGVGVAHRTNTDPQHVVRTVEKGGNRYTVTTEKQLGELCLNGTMTPGEGGNLTKVAESVLNEIGAPTTLPNTDATVKYLSLTGGKEGVPLQGPNGLLPDSPVQVTRVCSEVSPKTGERVLSIPSYPGAKQ
ncbi:MAG: hypothetical protein WAQ24_00820 [Candidatus Saccharimonadales bacterium]